MSARGFFRSRGALDPEPVPVRPCTMLRSGEVLAATLCMLLPAHSLLKNLLMNRRIVLPAAALGLILTAIVSTQFAVGQFAPYDLGQPFDEPKPAATRPYAESPGYVGVPIATSNSDSLPQPFKDKFVRVMLKQGYLNSDPLLLEDARSSFKTTNAAIF